jgi:hypothetical protein
MLLGSRVRTEAADTWWLGCPIENVNAPWTGWVSAETTCQATV